VKNQQPYLADKNEFSSISGNHWLSTDWKLVDFFFLITPIKKTCYAHETTALFFLPTVYHTQDISGITKKKPKPDLLALLTGNLYE